MVDHKSRGASPMVSRRASRQLSARLHLQRILIALGRAAHRWYLSRLLRITRD
jgi:hypothetical protein